MRNPVRSLTVTQLAALALGPPVYAYIRTQRDRLQAQAERLPQRDKDALETYFSQETLDRVRILIADPLPISEPPLASTCRRLGFDFPNISQVEAITFDHVIACRNAMSRSLLFHELVHVVQYQLLGIGGFARHYVKSFLATRSYAAIPLEQSAFDLQWRYETEGRPFEVEGEVFRHSQRT